MGEVGEIIDLDEIVGQTLIEEELPLEVPAEKEKKNIFKMLSLHNLQTYYREG